MIWVTWVLQVGGDALWVDERELAQGGLPALGERALDEAGLGFAVAVRDLVGGFLGAFPRAFVLDVHDRQPEQLDRGVIVGEVAAVLDDLAALVVQRLDAVGRVNDFAQSGSERQERDEPFPGVLPGRGRGRVLLAQVGVGERGQRGQRGGIGIGGVKDRPEEPWFVLAKDLDNNCLIVGQGHEHPMMLSNELHAYKLDWIEGLPPADIFRPEGLRCMAKSRYRQPDQVCRVFATTENGNEVRVTFDEPQRAVTPGQSAVFYIDEVCLGGGVIASIDAPCGF